MTMPVIDEMPDAPTRGESPAAFQPKVAAFLAALVSLVPQLNAAITWLNDIVAGAGFTATSTTSLSIGTGSKTWTVQANRSFLPGAYITAADSANPTTKYMSGVVTSYNASTGALAVTVDDTAGSGTVASWNISIGGRKGPQPTLATAAELLAGTEDTKAASAEAFTDALAKLTLTDQATITWDTNQGVNAEVTIANNRTMAAPTNLKEGMAYVLWVIQGTGGSRLMTWNAVFDWGNKGAPTLSTTVGKRDQVIGMCYDDGGTKKLRCEFSKAA
jgi:hypothetical protein